VTYIIFLVILYFQQEDFLYYTNPNISYLKDKNLVYKNAIKIDKSFLPLYFKGQSQFGEFKDTMFEHLNFNSYIYIRFFNQSGTLKQLYNDII
jgi:hypothetical protein